MKQRFIHVLFAMAALVLANQSIAQDGLKGERNQSLKMEPRVFSTEDRASPRAQLKVSIVPNGDSADTVKIVVDVTIAKGWHICPTVIKKSEFGLPTTIKIASGDLVAVGKVFDPSVEPTVGKVGEETQRFHQGKFSWTREYKSRIPINQIDAKATIRFQVCDDQQCLPPKKMVFALSAMEHAEKAASEQHVKFDHKTIGAPIEVALKECGMERRKVKLGDLTMMSIIFSGIGEDKLDLTGQITHDGETFDIYLPEADKYILKNTGDGATRFQNTADYLAIDHNKNGEIEGWESVAMNTPLRIMDSMFRVSSADRKAKTVTFQQIAAPIFGAIVGRKCPPFSYTSTDGETITDKSILGKVTILDIWAAT